VMFAVTMAAPSPGRRTQELRAQRLPVAREGLGLRVWDAPHARSAHRLAAAR
jgi:hypothetical protein